MKNHPKKMKLLDSNHNLSILNKYICVRLTLIQWTQYVFPIILQRGWVWLYETRSRLCNACRGLRHVVPYTHRKFWIPGSRGIHDYSSIALLLLQNTGLANFTPTPMNSLLQHQTKGLHNNICLYSPLRGSDCIMLGVYMYYILPFSALL